MSVPFLMYMYQFSFVPNCEFLWNKRVHKNEFILETHIAVAGFYAYTYTENMCIH